MYVRDVCVLFQMLRHCCLCRNTHQNSFSREWFGKFSLHTVKRFIWNAFNVIFLHFFFRHRGFFDSVDFFLFDHFFKGSFELTNKPYIKTSYVSFCLKRFPLGSCTTLMMVLVALSSLLCTLSHYFRFAFAVASAIPIFNLLKLFHFIFFSFDARCIPFQSKCTEKCYSTFGGSFWLNLCAIVCIQCPIVETFANGKNSHGAGSLWLKSLLPIVRTII